MAALGDVYRWVQGTRGAKTARAHLESSRRRLDDVHLTRILPPGHYRLSMRLLLAWLACVPSAAALVASGSTYSRLQAVQVTRASDAQTLGLTSLWGESDRAALFFLRHFG